MFTELNRKLGSANLNTAPLSQINTTRKATDFKIDSAHDGLKVVRRNGSFIFIQTAFMNNTARVNTTPSGTSDNSDVRDKSNSLRNLYYAQLS